MSDLSVAVALPIQVKINDRVYTFTPLKVSDWAFLEDWAEKDLREKGKAVSSEEVSRRIFSLAAIPQKTYLMLRRSHLEITLAEAENLLTMEAYNKIYAQLYGAVDSTDMELLAAARKAAALKAEGKDAAEAETELKSAIDKAAEEVRQSKARPTENP
jgi:fatty acid-binding protein DegV